MGDADRTGQDGDAGAGGSDGDELFQSREDGQLHFIKETAGTTFPVTAPVNATPLEEDEPEGVIPPSPLWAMKERRHEQWPHLFGHPDRIRACIGSGDAAVYAIDDGKHHCMIGRRVGATTDGCVYSLVARIPRTPTDRWRRAPSTGSRPSWPAPMSASAAPWTGRGWPTSSTSTSTTDPTTSPPSTCPRHLHRIRPGPAHRRPLTGSRPARRHRRDPASSSQVASAARRSDPASGPAASSERDTLASTLSGRTAGEQAGRVPGRRPLGSEARGQDHPTQPGQVERRGRQGGPHHRPDRAGHGQAPVVELGDGLEQDVLDRRAVPVSGPPSCRLLQGPALGVGAADDHDHPPAGRGRQIQGRSQRADPR